MPHFSIHLVAPEGHKEVVQLEADNPDTVRETVRKKLPGYRILKVKRMREVNDGR